MRARGPRAEQAKQPEQEADGCVTLRPPSVPPGSYMRVSACGPKQRVSTAAARARLGAALALAALLGVPAAAGHEIRPAVVDVALDPQRYEIVIAANLEAWLAGVSPAHRDTDESPNAREYDRLRALAPEALEREAARFLPSLLERIEIEFDGRRVRPRLASVTVPPVGDLAVSRISRIALEGEPPAGATSFRWRYPPELGSSVLRVRRAGDPEVRASWLKDGQASEPIPLAGAVAAPGRAELAGQYLALGFTHILPKGLDHILFVLGLFLLSARMRPLLIQVTAFTVAHSITLALGIYGAVALSPAIVEPLIAASIVYVAVENLVTSRLHAWRPVVVFGFGLLHGMGFAGALREIGLPRAEFVTGLVAFNVGVELGQLAVIALVYALVGLWGRGGAAYRARVVVPASALIAAVGLYWTVERVIG